MKGMAPLAMKVVATGMFKPLGELDEPVADAFASQDDPVARHDRWGNFDIGQ